MNQNLPTKIGRDYTAARGLAIVSLVPHSGQIFLKLLNYLWESTILYVCFLYFLTQQFNYFFFHFTDLLLQNIRKLKHFCLGQIDLEFWEIVLAKKTTKQIPDKSLC